MKYSRLPLLSLLVIVLLSGSVWAGGWQYPGVGARPKAMGNAFRAISDDGYGAYYNPAGIAYITSNIFNGTAELSGPRPSVTPDFTDAGYGFGYLDGQTRYPKDLIYLEGTTSLFFRPRKTDKFALGLAFFQSYDQNADMNLFQISSAYNDKSQIQGENHVTNFDLITWQPTIAMKFSDDKIAVGVGFQIHRGDILMDQVRLVDNPYAYPFNVRPFDKFPKLNQFDGFGYGVGGNFGIQIRPSDKLSFGATFTTGSKFNITGTSKEQVFMPHSEAIYRYFNDPQSPMREEMRRTFQTGEIFGIQSNFDVELTLPKEFGVGVAYKPTPQTTLAADIVYTTWSDFKELRFKIKDRQFGIIGFPDSWRTLLTDMVYPMNWDNKVKLSLGIESVVSPRWTIRGGYMYDPTPIPDNTFSELFMDTGNKHNLSIGAGFKLNDRVSFDGTVQGVFSPSRTITQLSDVNNDGLYDNFAGTFKNTSFNTSWALNYRF